MTTYAYQPEGVSAIADTKGGINHFEYDYAQRHCFPSLISPYHIIMDASMRGQITLRDLPVLPYSS